MGVFGSFIFKEWIKFKNRKIRFMKVLFDNFYFKNLDNNVGVFYMLIDVVEEEDCKEVLLVYIFLLKCSEVFVEGGVVFCVVCVECEIVVGGMILVMFDSVIESYFLEEFDCVFDFDVIDVVNKLVDMELVE